MNTPRALIESGLRADELSTRMRAAVTLGWDLFSRKVGAGCLRINKEASMQLQFAHILQHIAPLIEVNATEKVEVELETGVHFDRSRGEIDIFMTGSRQERAHRIAIELKCYLTQSSSGGKRGAQDIFMKDVYEDLQALERYVSEGSAEQGVALVMTDHKRFAVPTKKNGKCWAYDTSHGAAFGPLRCEVPIGGKAVSIVLNRQYRLEWQNYGAFWFTEIEGMSDKEL